MNWSGKLKPWKKIETFKTEKMKQYLYYILLILSGSHLNGQSLDRFVTGSAGTTVSNEMIQLSFTVGEPVVGNVNQDQIQLFQGFQQEAISEINTSANTGAERPELTRTITVYPNPVNTLLYLEMNMVDSEDPLVELYTLAGNRVNVEIIRKSGNDAGNYSGQIEFSGLPKGVYLLKLISTGGDHLKVIKILKI
jgi:hypothetical protein